MIYPLHYLPLGSIYTFKSKNKLYIKLRDKKNIHGYRALNKHYLPYGRFYYVNKRNKNKLCRVAVL